MRIFLAALAISMSWHDLNGMSEKDARRTQNAEVIRAISVLHELTLHVGPKVEEEIRSAVCASRDPATLAQIALVARSMVSGLAEHATVDEIYWKAFWTCAKQLSRRGDSESRWHLERLADAARLGGGDLLAMRQLLREQR
jgi:hypothetical protein